MFSQCLWLSFKIVYDFAWHWHFLLVAQPDGLKLVLVTKDNLHSGQITSVCEGRSTLFNLRV